MDLDKVVMEMRNRLTDLESKIGIKPTASTNQLDASAHGKIQAFHDRLTTVEQQVKNLLTPSNMPADAGTPQPADAGTTTQEQKS